MIADSFRLHRTLFHQNCFAKHFTKQSLFHLCRRIGPLEWSQCGGSRCGHSGSQSFLDCSVYFQILPDQFFIVDNKFVLRFSGPILQTWNLVDWCLLSFELKFCRLCFFTSMIGSVMLISLFHLSWFFSLRFSGSTLPAWTLRLMFVFVWVNVSSIQLFQLHGWFCVANEVDSTHAMTFLVSCKEASCASNLWELG